MKTPSTPARAAAVLYGVLEAILTTLTHTPYCLTDLQPSFMFESPTPLAPGRLLASNYTRQDSSFWNFTFPWQESHEQIETRLGHWIPSFPQILLTQVFLMITCAELGLDEKHMVNWFTWPSLGGGNSPSIADHLRARPTV